jgi:mRNA turnover protein 4
MPKSKRDKVISLTKVKKKTKDAKSELVDKIQEAVTASKYVYVLEVENERNDLLKLCRAALRPGTIFCGKNKVMQLALGLTPQSEYEDNIRLISKEIAGACALLCTDAPVTEVRKKLTGIEPTVYARHGSVATKRVALNPGTEALKAFPHSQEPHLRQLGLPTLLKDGVIHLLGKHTVCEKGDVLTTDKAQLLKQLSIPMVKFQVRVKARWSRPGETEVYEN